MTTTCTGFYKLAGCAAQPAVPPRSYTRPPAGAGAHAPQLPPGGARAVPASYNRRRADPVPISDNSEALVLGRPSAAPLGESLLPKRLALPIFASDPLSSVAYATQEILIVLTLAGTAFLYLAPWLAIAVVLLLATVVLSYRQVVRAYPSGGGDYEVAIKNHGQFAGLTVASALLVDYVLTVAVSVAAGTDNIISAFPALNEHRVAIAVGLVALLAAANLRGLRESGRTFAVPTYMFISGILVMVVTGLLRHFLGDGVAAESASYAITPEPGFEQVTGLALVFFVLRAFASGAPPHRCGGDRQRRPGVQAAEEPQRRHDAGAHGRHRRGDVLPASQRWPCSPTSGTPSTRATWWASPPARPSPSGRSSPRWPRRVFGGPTSPGFFYIQAATALVLILAANTAFNGFPLLGSVLAQDRFLPRQLHTRGDKLVYSNGILLLAGFAALLIAAFDADVNRLIQMYIVGVFTSFSIGQWGMVRHWNRELRSETDPQARARHPPVAGDQCRRRHPDHRRPVHHRHEVHPRAWLVLLVMPVLFLLMRAINRHYSHVADQLVPDTDSRMLPSKVHAVVLVSRVHKPTLRALAFARATRPDHLTALTVNVDDADTRALQQQWERYDIPVPLTVVESPYREITRPVVDFVKSIRRDSPRELVVVFVPQYVVGHWWENVLHNQSALRLRARLQFQPGVMITSVPWQLESSVGREDAGLRATGPAPGDLRRGLADEPEQTPYG
jgi:amino acid transporter